ncbi:MAG: NlpC/P60 family protein [candidate division Zixibacteria bacterium]
MKRLSFLILILPILIGCQGTPRYGGGIHTTEGKAKVKQTKAKNYAVDPIVMGNIIDRYLGKPYAGRSESERGYDCSEFIGAIYLDYNSVHLPRTTEKLWKTGRIVERGDFFFGDLVFFDTGGKGVSHAGIYIGFDEFVHASSSNGIIISNMSEKYWKKRFLGARRVIE